MTDTESDIRKKVEGLLGAWRMPVREMEKILSFGKAAVPALVEALEGDSDDEKNYLWPIVLLGEFRSPEAIPVLISYVRRARHMDPLAYAAAESLAKIGPPAIPALIQVVEEGASSARLYAYVGLGRITDERCYKALCAALKKDREMGDVVANVLVDLGRRDAIPHIYHALQKCAPWQRVEFEDSIHSLHRGEMPFGFQPQDWRARYRPLPNWDGDFDMGWVWISSIVHSDPKLQELKSVKPIRPLQDILNDPPPIDDITRCSECREAVSFPTGLPVCPENAAETAVVQEHWLKGFDKEGYRNIFEVLDDMDEEEWELREKKPWSKKGKKLQDERLEILSIQRQTALWLIDQGVRRVDEALKLLEKKRAEIEAQYSEPSLMSVQQRKVGRNAPCPCGSGKKYKKCCLPKEESRRKPSTPEIADQWAYRIGSMERSLAKMDTSKLMPGKTYTGPISDLMTQEIPHAQELVYDGWELLGRGDMKGTRKVFREALKADASLADIHNGLASIAWVRGDLAEAGKEYRNAYEKARVSLGTEEPQAFSWWGELKTRPYMRARHGLGLVYWKQGRYDEALHEFTALLHLNPNDNQGVRFLIAPLYQLKGDLDAAFAAYESYAQGYPDDIPDPHYYASWGLALVDAGRLSEALQKWHRMIFSNIYIAPVILGHDSSQVDIWHGSNLAMKDYAIEYIAEFGEIWEKKLVALAILERLWKDPEVQARVERYVEIGEELKDVEPGKKMTRLLDARRLIEEASVSRECMERIIGKAGY